MIFKWARIRRRLGLSPTRAELAAEVELWRRRNRGAEAERDAAYVRAKNSERELRAFVHEGLNEPGRVDGCTKVRFHREPEARDWADAIARRTGEKPEDYHTYQCKKCPRSPVTMARYWHAGHPLTPGAVASKEAYVQRRRAEQKSAAGNGRLLGQRVDPRVLAQLRRIKEEGSDDQI